MKQPTVPDVVQKMETEYIRGSTNISAHVTFSMVDTLNRIDAYLNSKHISGENDSQGRPKPFFNIVVAAANIWMRATDIDRKHIKLQAKNSKEWLNSFFANAVLQDWMRREAFGQTLNEWGRVLARYGSAVIKFVENKDGLHITVVPWNRLIVDAVSFEPNPKIEILELTEQELRARIELNGYDAEQVEALIDAKTTRETTDKRKKDNKSDYYKLYEIHGRFSRSQITGEESDEKIFEQQMHVISFVGGTSRKEKDQDFILYKGKEKNDPYMITHLIKEDGRTLAIGAVEHLFEAQWMQNHSAKAIKDQLDIASKNVYQTSDANFVGRNLLTQLEQGDVLVTLPNMPITQVANAAQDVTLWQNYAMAWRDAGREGIGISEAMLGVAPKAGTAWRQTEAMLNESYSLFELMTENKGLYIEQWLRERILPYLIKKYDTKEEITAFFEKHDLQRIDRMYVKNNAIKKTNTQILDSMERMLADDSDEIITPEDQMMMTQENEQEIQSQLGEMGNQRFLEPSDISWKDQLEDIEWDIEMDVTGESKNIQEMMTTLNTALSLVVTPGFDQNPKAQALVGRILELTGAMSPVEYASLPPATAPVSAGAAGAEFELPDKKEENMK